MAHSWEGPTTRVQRMYVEGCLIYERQPEVNRDGRQLGPGGERHGDRILLGRCRKFWQCIRFRRMLAGRPREISAEEYRERGRLEKDRKMRLFPTAIKMAKRPLPKTEDMEKFTFVKRVRQVGVRELVRLVRVGGSCLDATGRSIMSSNRNRIMKDNKNVTWTTVTCKSALSNVKGIEEVVVKSMKKWAKAWLRRGVVLLLKVRMVGGASHSALSYLDSTGYWAKQESDKGECVYAMPEYAGFSLVVIGAGGRPAVSRTKG